MRKWRSKDDPRVLRGSLPDPIRIEEKMVHGVLVKVKIYAAAFVPLEYLEVDSKGGSQIHQIMGNTLSPIWSGEKSFDIETV